MSKPKTVPAKPAKRAIKKRKVGRPSKGTVKMRDLICEQLADGKSLRAICKQEGMPRRQTVERWQADDADFAAKCARAREEQAEFHHAEMDTIEANVLDGTLDPKAASVVLANKRWRMEKLKPKVYGQKIGHELTGPGGGPVQQVNLTQDEFAQTAREVLGKI